MTWWISTLIRRRRVEGVSWAGTTAGRGAVTSQAPKSFLIVRSADAMVMVSNTGSWRAVAMDNGFGSVTVAGNGTLAISYEKNAKESVQDLSILNLISKSVAKIWREKESRLDSRGAYGGKATCKCFLARKGIDSTSPELPRGNDVEIEVHPSQLLLQ